MAATDKPYRSPQMLDRVFGVSCVLMLVATIWMFVDDYNRPWKRVQRDFRDVETAVAQQTLVEQVEQQIQGDSGFGNLDAASKELEEAKKKLNTAKAGIATKLRSQKQKAEANYQQVKADLDSVVSLYDQDVDRFGKDSATSQSRRKELGDLRQKLDKAGADIEKANGDLADAQKSQREAEKEVEDAQRKVKSLAGQLDLVARVAAQKRWKVGDWVRALPVIDGFASPVKIQQTVLEELPIDYAFKRVPRYDRCTTCHLGIEKSQMDLAILRKLVDGPTDKQLENLKAAKEVLAKRYGRDEALGFDPSDLPTSKTSVKLTEAQAKQYAAHPRLDLFVSPDSPHSVAKFGCTICHSGQGSATEFVLASHAPNDAVAQEEWVKNHGWKSSHYWDFPMRPARFTESSCLQCHHQVTDLVHGAAKAEVVKTDAGTREVAGPGSKVLRGYHLVRENGCFGCHEIAGFKGGRSVGPDLRLEPNTPLEKMSAEERQEVLADAGNPPGAVRKVGPSLARIGEKTSEKWLVQWLHAPRGFRPSTKMPHFYNLSNNETEALKRSGQEAFPAAEMHAVAAYLKQESDNYLKKQDKTRRALAALEKQLKDRPNATDADRKKLKEAQRKLAYIQETDAPALASGTLVDGDGKKVALPAAATDAKAQQDHGRQLFTMKGCLACHVHQGTTSPGAGGPAVVGESNFGPDLSRVSAKIAKDEAGRRWLVQWILNPQVHSPRSRMPVTHLSVQEADAIASWLLSNDANWEAPTVAEPNLDALRDLAKVYLSKVGMTRREINEALAASGNGVVGLKADQVASQAEDGDEKALVGPVSADQLKYYIGKKSVGRLGCYACHNIPGFENAKPIGTPLNDWGKKEGERLAFEDIKAYVGEKIKGGHYVEVDRLGGKDTPEVEGGKELYEKFFREALEHHSREGFLYQKLAEPRSYDHNRIRTWDDRLRMPQFKFARGQATPRAGETVEQAEAREELEAREAVMTFILGLVAEPVPEKYVYNPSADRKAEVKGLQILDKYNCAGCHQLRPGQYEFKASAEVLSSLQDNRELKADEYVFPEHNAWTGTTQTRKDRVLIHGVPQVTVQAGRPKGDDADPNELTLWSTQAVRLDGAEGTKQIPAAASLILPRGDLVGVAAPDGGLLPRLLIGYLMDPGLQTALKAQNRLPRPEIVINDAKTTRMALPPSLLRQGEKTQPAWLYGFLRNPSMVRPGTVLRMPRFNMSDDEAMALVNYFSAVDRLKNPSLGLTSPYAAIPQKSEEFWRERNAEYLARLGADKVKEREAKLQPVLDQYAQERLADLDRKVKAAEEAVKAATKPAEKAAGEERLNALKKEHQDLKVTVDNKYYQGELLRQWRDTQAYATDAFRMLGGTTSPCLKCHQVPAFSALVNSYPPLQLTHERLRPDFLQRWLANPKRLMIHGEGQHPMPANFSRDVNTLWGPEFIGRPADPAWDQLTALRDVLMIYPKLSEMPAGR